MPPGACARGPHAARALFVQYARQCSGLELIASEVSTLSPSATRLTWPNLTHMSSRVTDVLYLIKCARMHRAELHVERRYGVPRQLPDEQVLGGAA
eukprot:COSAG01_NODE_48656_length_379_cov_0.742857_2_plen_95_part_01